MTYRINNLYGYPISVKLDDNNILYEYDDGRWYKVPQESYPYYLSQISPETQEN